MTALQMRAEEASLNAWPAPRQVLLHGWVLRFGGGYTRRANSVTPLSPMESGSASLPAKIAACEALYEAQGLPTLIRTRSFTDGPLLAALAERGYVAEGLSVPCAFAAARVNGPGSPIGSVAFAAVHDGMACLHAVATDPVYRRLGLSRRVVSALLAWACASAGAREASLQVAVENEAALRLYAGLGFQTELYRYQYHRRPVSRHPPC